MEDTSAPSGNDVPPILGSSSVPSNPSSSSTQPHPASTPADLPKPDHGAPSVLVIQTQGDDAQLDMFDIELQKEFADASSRQRQTPPDPTALLSSSGNPNGQPGGSPWLYSRPSDGEFPALGPGGMQLSSVADALKISDLVQDPERSVRLIGELAAVIRRHCEEQRRSSPRVTPTASTAGAGVSNREFEDGVSLVTSVVEELHQVHPYLSASSNVPRHASSARAVPTQYYPVVGSSVPAGRMGHGVRLHLSPSPSSKHNGRSTIDTEVSDSLYRLQVTAKTKGAEPAWTSSVDFRRRPANPCKGCSSQLASDANLPKSISVAVPEASSNPGLESPRMEYPRPVKPATVANKSCGASQSSRGPRSKTGKNICPSNYSAFSECSGGDSRSFHSSEKTEAQKRLEGIPNEMVSVCAM